MTPTLSPHRHTADTGHAKASAAKASFETGFGEVSDRSSGRFVGNAQVGFVLAGCAQVESNSISQSSKVQSIADYAKLSLSNHQPIMLALKKFIPLLRRGTLHKEARRIIGVMPCTA
jgi:hypothetical protein